MFFASDNWAGAHPQIADALKAHAGGFDVAYGAGELDHRVEARFAEIFDHEVSVWFLPTGTACNSLALAAVNRVGGVAFAHPEAHIREDEGGAPEFLASGVRVRPVPGNNGKIDPATLHATIKPFSPGTVNRGRALGVSITQASEIGTIYSPGEIDAISGICREFDLPLHMDGARFANALVTLGCAPADMTWKRGVDILSFGGTKNGCWCAEALVFFQPEMARDMPQLRKRSGHLFSKSRFVAAQFLAYFDNDLWLDLAANANQRAREVSNMLCKHPGTELVHPVQGNEIFVRLDDDVVRALKDAGATFYPWINDSYRLVTSWATPASQIDAVSALLV